MTTLAPNPWTLGADILDPPAWEPANRPPLLAHQVAPPMGWRLWLMLGGRGSGKTEGCARYFARYMRRNPGHRGRIIAPTLGDAVSACVEGPSGLLAIDPEIRFIPSAPGGARVVWPNGSMAMLIGTPTPREVDRLRAAGNVMIDWWEEMAANPMLDKAWVQAQFGLRLGGHPHAIASTTPRVRDRLIWLLKQPWVATTRATIFDNPYLNEQVKRDLLAEYEGTRIGRQELYGELLDDIEGALWTWAMVERARELWGELELHELDSGLLIPDFQRAGVAVDPAVTSTEDSDVVGIIGGGLVTPTLGAVCLDRSVQGVRPSEWARRAVQAFDDLDADRLIAETNQGGELVEETLRVVRPGIPYRSVHASRGKRTRAEPVSAQWEQGRWALGPGTDDLAAELTGWDPEASRESPGRLDAMVWLSTWLMPPGRRPARTSVPRGSIQGAAPRRTAMQRRIG